VFLQALAPLLHPSYILIEVTVVAHCKVFSVRGKKISSPQYRWPTLLFRYSSHSGRPVLIQVRFLRHQRHEALGADVNVVHGQWPEARPGPRLFFDDVQGKSQAETIAASYVNQLGRRGEERGNRR